VNKVIAITQLNIRGFIRMSFRRHCNLRVRGRL
jgi:hypothetical protein